LGLLHRHLARRALLRHSALARSGALAGNRWRDGAATGRSTLLLGARGQLLQYQQWRCRKRAGRLQIAWEGLDLGEIDVPPQATRVGLTSDWAMAMFDLVRVTALPEYNTNNYV
jgi:hypothetical protein